MRVQFRELLKHSGIYGVGQVLSRLTSILLLPIYTRYLSRADYGLLAILDLTVAVLGILLATGLQRAVNRHHFDRRDAGYHNRLWWTGLSLLVTSLAIVVGPLWLLRGPLARAVLGPEVDRSGHYLGLALITLSFVSLEQFLQAHLRVQRRSRLLVGLGLGRLAVNAALNLYLLVGAGLGVEAVLWGNLGTGVLAAGVFFAIFARERGAWSFDRQLVASLAAYGGPLVLTSLMAVGMHQADRYLLRVLLDLASVGLYSVAYAIGHGINTLILSPFSQIWYVVIYEVEGDEESRVFYVEAFRLFVYVLGLIMLGVSLFAEPLLHMLVAPDFRAASDLVPIICLGYLLFSLHTHFNVPALLTKRTRAIIVPHALALVTNVVGNLLLIPAFGIFGAAWSTVVTFAVFSFSGLLVYRRIDRLPYPLAVCGSVIAGMTFSYLAWRSLAPEWSGRPVVCAASAFAVWGLWATVLLAPGLRRRFRPPTRPRDLA